MPIHGVLPGKIHFGLPRRKKVANFLKAEREVSGVLVIRTAISPITARVRKEET